MNGFDVRALEIHGNQMWDEAHVRRALDFIGRHRMNSLVFHGTDIVHEITFPRQYFGAHARWTESPPRRGENAIYNKRKYIQNIGKLCRRDGVSFFLEVKEIAFPEEILEVFPDLIRDGVICPSDSRWVEFLDGKYDELFGDFPNIAGVIVSIGSPEGRASMAARRCHCQRCQDTSLPQWYRDVTAPLHRAAQRHGRRLVVREFSYKPESQEAVIEGLRQLPDTVEYMVKAYPHDFYPTFPDNPGLDVLPERTKWVEYDVHGQYYGWGVVPCPVAEDIATRLRTARDKGASAVILRTDWERVNTLSCLDTANILNLAVAADLAVDVSANERAALRTALMTEGMIDVAHYSPERMEALTDTLLEIWPAFSHTLYLQDFVLNYSSMFPHGVEHAWWTMVTKYSLLRWDAAAAERIDLTDPTKVDAILAEKEAGLNALRTVTARLRTFAGSLLRLPIVAGVKDPLSLMERYVEGFVRCAKVAVLAKATEQAKNGPALYRESLAIALADLESYYVSITRWAEETQYSHHVYMLIDTERVGAVLLEGREYLRRAAA